MDFISKFSKTFGNLQSIVNDFAASTETKVSVNFTDDGPVVQRDSGSQTVPQIKSEDLSSPLASLDEETANLVARFEGEVRDLKQMIEGGNALADLCTAIRKQPLPPHLQEAKARLVGILAKSLESASHQKLKETLAGNNAEGAKSLTKSFIAAYPHARNANAAILRSIANMLDQKLSQVDPQVRKKIEISVMKRAELTLERAQQSLHKEKSEKFAAHLVQNVTAGETFAKTVNNCQAAAQTFLEVNQEPSKQSGAIDAFLQSSEKAAAEVLDRLKSENTETMTQYDVQILTDQVMGSLDMGKIAAEALREGVSQSSKDNEKEADDFAKALQTSLHKKAQNELNCSKEDLLEALSGCQNEEEKALVIGKILMEVTDRADNALYEHTLRLLEEAYPDIRKFCLDTQDGYRLLSPKGIEVMMEVLKQKGKFRDVPVNLCVVPEQAIAQLEQLAKGATGDKMGLILRYDANPSLEMESDDVHYFAVMAEKTDQGLRIAITDSFTTGYYRRDFVDGLEDRFNNLGIPCKVLLPKISFNPETGREVAFRRQTDSYSCPIFALRDISQFCQHPEILDEIERHASPTDANSSVKLVPFERFPKALMKATQSLSKIAAYDDKSLASDLRQTGKINPLRARKKPGQFQDANTLILDRNRKYERIMIAAAIHRGLVKQTE